MTDEELTELECVIDIALIFAIIHGIDTDEGRACLQAALELHHDACELGGAADA
jgi:hypothetical protein